MRLGLLILLGALGVGVASADPAHSLPKAGDSDLQDSRDRKPAQAQDRPLIEEVQGLEEVVDAFSGIQEGGPTVNGTGEKTERRGFEDLY